MEDGDLFELSDLEYMEDEVMAIADGPDGPDGTSTSSTASSTSTQNPEPLPVAMDFRGCSSFHEVIAKAASSEESRNVVAQHLGASIFNMGQQTIRMGVEGARAREDHSAILLGLTKEVLESLPGNRVCPRRTDGIRSILYDYLINRHSMIRCGVLTHPGSYKVRAVMTISGYKSCMVLSSLVESALKVSIDKQRLSALTHTWDQEYSRDGTNKREPWRMVSFVREYLVPEMHVESCPDFKAFMDALLVFCIHNTNDMERAVKMIEESPVSMSTTTTTTSDTVTMNTVMDIEGTNNFGLRDQVRKQIQHRDYKKLRGLNKRYAMYMLTDVGKCTADPNAGKMSTEECAWTYVFAFRMLCIFRSVENSESVGLLNKASSALYQCEQNEITAKACDNTFKTLNVNSAANVVCKTNTAMLMMTQAAAQTQDPQLRQNMSSKDAYHEMAVHMDTYNAMNDLQKAADQCANVVNNMDDTTNNDAARQTAKLFPITSCQQLDSWPEQFRYTHVVTTPGTTSSTTSSGDSAAAAAASVRCFRFGVQRLDWTLFNKEYKRVATEAGDYDDDDDQSSTANNTP